MDLSILLSPTGDSPHLHACLESLGRTLPTDLDWELVASGLPNGAEPPRDRLREVQVDSRFGLAASRNAAARAARAPILCFLSPGAVLMPGWLPPMLTLLRGAPAAGCIGNVHREPYSGLIDHAGIRFDDDGLPVAFWSNQPLLPRDASSRHPAVSLACALVSREVFARLGGFDERFGGPLGDVDFCLRAAAVAHRRNYVANRSMVYAYQADWPDSSPETDAALYRSLWGDRARAAHARRATLGTAATADLQFTEAWEMSREHRRLWRQQLRDTRREGNTYLRKHLHRPWRYNYGRVCQALAKVLHPLPPALPRTLGTRFQETLDAARCDDGWIFDPPPQ